MKEWIEDFFSTAIVAFAMTLLVGGAILFIMGTSMYVFAKAFTDTCCVTVCLAIADACVLREILKSIYDVISNCKIFDDDEEFD